MVMIPEPYALKLRIYVGLEVAAGTVLKPGTLKHDSDAAMARVGSPSSPPPAMPLLLLGGL